MRKAYTITPDEYREKRREINNIGYKNGWNDPKTGRYTLSEGTGPGTRKRFENLTRECDGMPKPEDKLFFMGTDIYNLWLNRDTDEPVTARELYNIIKTVGDAISQAESNARSSAVVWDTWGGRV